MTLDEATSKLEAISLNPCACDVCKHAARLAREALMEVSPLGERLLQTPERNSDEFRELERQFRDAELERLNGALETIACKCMMLTPAPPPALPEIPSLPYQQGLSDAIERYRKYTRRIEMKPKPRIPGTYVIK